MAKYRVSEGARRKARLSASCGIRKQTTMMRKVKPHEARRSARLSAISQPKSSGNRREKPEPNLHPVGEILQNQASGTSIATHKHPLKRKRKQEIQYEIQYPSSSAQDSPTLKRPRTSVQDTTQRRSREVEEVTSTTVTKPLQNWVLNERWPTEYFEPDGQAREDLLGRDSWLEIIMEQPPVPVVQYVEQDGFRYPLPVKKAPTSLRRKQSDSSLTGTSDQKNRESKSAAYRDTRYKTLLAAKGSFLCDFGDDDPPKSVTGPGRKLLSIEQDVPQNSLFRDDLFRRFCREIEDRNEAMIVQDVSRLLVPSAKNLAIYGDRRLDALLENVNEAWTGCVPVEGPRPQPDYSVGFRRSAFTDEQLTKLDPLIGGVFDTSFFVATYRMYFPFLACEVKCGAAALDIADRQNAHSMTIAVRSVVELYRAVKREKELDREILAFSVSHDHRSVRIYGHYPVIDGDKVTYYRHPIHEFSFTALEGKDKWTAYKFTKSVYDFWMPTHFKRICSAIDQLPPSLDFQVFQKPGVQFEEGTGLSREMGGLLSEPSDADPASHVGLKDDDLTPIIPQTATPDTSVSRGRGQGTAKRVKNNRNTKSKMASGKE